MEVLLVLIEMGKFQRGGCIFCSENGSGDFTSGKLKSIHQQIDEQIELVAKKYKGDKYIAYFQKLYKYLCRCQLSKKKFMKRHYHIKI